MTTIMVDDDGGCMMGTLLPPPPDFVPPTIAELLAEGFEWRNQEVCFFVCGNRPVLLWPGMDYATDWSVHPIREVHPFHPICHGKQISEEVFRALVKRIHGLD